MRQKRHLILCIACFMSIVLCALLLLQAAGIVRPVGVGWGDGTRARAYSVEVKGPIVFRTAWGMRPAPPGSYAYGVQSLGRSEGVGISYHRWNLTAGGNPQAPVLGAFMELRVALAWPIVMKMSLVSLWVILVIRKRRADRDGGRCLNCGYDLRATPERCPECGSVPAAARPAA
jgi:hypothetical protein